MTYRTLRAANASLYLVAILVVWGAAAYVVLSRDSLWQQLFAAAAALISLLWGGYYLRLRYTVDAQGLTRRGLWGSRRLLWEGAVLTLTERSTPETRSLTLCAEQGGITILLSSDELPLEQVEELVAELRAHYELHTAPAEPR